ncbi:TetR/AcrR family transcriptional regulator [Demequina sp.]|uniref:TetR/AcrR family transcriptional regulator n=1 Tax=Demequina sp. TaxID=2050685 RepID=UPI0025D8DFA3|nr:TetR/AcrR family transcriptional regulator [Demequina sp.]
MTVKTGRARPMAVEERRASIVDVAIPLIIERGGEVTTREIADAAGIAEGTVFRAFADKNEIIDAAIARVMDPAETLTELEAIGAALPLAEKIERVVTVLQARVDAVVRLMAALGPRDHARHRAGDDAHKPPLSETTGVVERLLEPDRDRLRVPVATAVDYLRILVFGTSMPFLSDGSTSDPSQLADFILRGISQEGR